ncbi:MAG: hypothetical protein OXR66_00480 [Candidatus Woesearchaeota archaeon]|nr:hypothetical protein [Candidatus Woesearchaeota archaeon]
MALSFSAGKKEGEQFREELRVLSTQIETINQQLSVGSGGAGPALSKSFADVNAKLTFIYEFLKTMQQDIKAENKENFHEVQTSVNSTIEKQLGDLYNNQAEQQKALQEMQEKLSSAPQFNAQDLANLSTKVDELTRIYTEEVQVFRDQNAYLQKKLDEIEKDVR